MWRRATQLPREALDRSGGGGGQVLQGVSLHAGTAHHPLSSHVTIPELAWMALLHVAQRGAVQEEHELASAAFGVLRDAARSRKRDNVTVEGAMLHLEALAVAGRLPVELRPLREAVSDCKHTLVFSTASSLSALRYIPVKVRSSSRRTSKPSSS